jgi:tetraacyldisaccharide 4'-kinase
MSEPAAARVVEGLWESRSPGAWLLAPFAVVFGIVIRLRRALYRLGILRTTHPGIPVIVVGNITVGGTGKTPVVAWLVDRLVAAGRKPAVVSRGYGGSQRGAPRVVTADSNAEAAKAGDEPVLLARRTGRPVVVCTDRVRAAERAVELGADVIVADDGLQHYALARDLEIAVVDGERRFGNGWLLPAGPLREPRSRLAEVALVLCNGGQAEQGMQPFRLEPRELIALGDGRRAPLSSLAGREVYALAGIGAPRRFIATLTAAGARPLVVPAPDHGRVDLGALSFDDSRPLVMTEKDAVKYSVNPGAAAWYLPVDVVMPPAAAMRLDDLLQRCLQTRRATA